MSEQWQPVSPPGKKLPASQAVVMLDADDDVGVAARDLEVGEAIEAGPVRSVVPKGHKVALRQVAAGAPVRKYAQVIGFAKAGIEPGDHVHVHNLDFRAAKLDYRVGADASPTAMVPAGQRATFQGYRRANGKVGTRNHVAVLSTVNCSATACRRIAAHFTPERLAGFTNVDGVTAFIHGTGCGMAGSGDGMDNLRRVMHGYATHPNVAGVVILGLGCEVNQVDALVGQGGLDSAPHVTALNIQVAGGLGKAVAQGIAAIEERLAEADACRREECPAAELTVALQCGGSDGWSGITANPALGHAVDLLVAQGGTGVIAETPEVYGAEHLLTARAAAPDVAAALLERIRWWEGYCERHGGSMDNNPTPGNKRGGLTTILEKSLGAVAKGGTTNLVGVYRYAQPVDRRGFCLMDSPGYDPASVTGQIAAGCNLVAFTTGRGSAFGSKPAPTLKICTNSDTFARMPDDMDVDAGRIASAGVPVSEVGEEIFARFLELASGQPSKSEAQGLGDHEFVPWQVGAVM